MPPRRRSGGGTRKPQLRPRTPSYSSGGRTKAQLKNAVPAQPKRPNLTKSPQQVRQDIAASGHLAKSSNTGRQMKGGVRTDVAAQGRASVAAQAGAGGGSGTGYEIPQASAGGDGSLQDLHDIEFDTYEAELQGGNPPSWWKPFKPKNRADMERPDIAYLTMLNASIPYLSPEDQRNAAAQLYTAHGNAFAIYKQSAINEVEPGRQTITHEQSLLSDAYKQDPSKFNVIDKDYYTSKSRATGFIDALNQMRLAIGNEGGTGTGFPRKHIGGTGQGYSWLQQLAGMQENYGSEGGAGQTRAQYLSQLGGLDPLFSLGQSPEIGPVAAIGQMFAKPFFSAGALTPTYQTPTGQTMFGDPNRLLF